MDNSDQDRRQRRAWGMVRQGGVGRRGVVGVREGARNAEPPTFIAGGKGKATAKRVAKQVRAVFRAHGKRFPKARLRAVLEAGGDVREDSDLAAWAAAFGVALGGVLTAAARASFLRGVDDAVAGENRGRRFVRDVVASVRASSKTEELGRAGRAAEPEVRRIVERVWQIVEEGLEQGWSLEEIMEAVDAYLSQDDDDDENDDIDRFIILIVWVLVFFGGTRVATGNMCGRAQRTRAGTSANSLITVRFVWAMWTRARSRLNWSSPAGTCIRWPTPGATVGWSTRGCPNGAMHAFAHKSRRDACAPNFRRIPGWG